MKRIVLIFITVAAVAALFAQTATNQTAAKKSATVPVYGFTVVHTYPHDRQAFTEGLELNNGFLYESTGLNGHSQIRKEKLETGEVLQKTDLGSNYFGEGITILGNRLVQLTWKNQIGFIRSLADFKEQSSFLYKGEGWALTHGAGEVFMSDGTPEVRILDPATLKELRRITVHDASGPIAQINELEYVDGQLFANIWQTDRIVRFSPRTGAVLGWIDLTGLLAARFRNGSEDVLNGIAYDSAAKRLFVTGKLWPSLFEIKLVPKK